MHDLGTLGGAWSDACAINASGQVTGESDTASGSNDAFLYSGGVMHDLGGLGGTDTRGIALNDAGEVTGYSELAGGNYDAFVYISGTVRAEFFADPIFFTGYSGPPKIDLIKSPSFMNSSKSDGFRK